ncbi:neuronal acetylcholine receptor subunit beta-4-like [Haliotis asinina]|uniref:neuronal acetylcholine receptor subunit beta-4-like n=1 Tax=Haliotis asinina TaxID=109174 RepID=UPI0035324971
MDLAWNTSQYHDNTIIEVEPGKLWTPGIILSNSIDSQEPVASRNVFVSWQGYASWQLPGTFRTSCKIDVYRYPFDKQRCLVTIMPTFGHKINFTVDAINLQSVKDMTVQNGEWNYLHTNSQLVPVEPGCVNAAQFVISLERRPTYYVINIIFPMVLMSLLNPCVFLIPARSGEKLAFLMAVFVSHAVFLNLIQQTMPPTSDSVSLLALFLALLEVQGFLTILASIAVLGVHHRKEKAEETAAKHKMSGTELVEVKHGRRFRGCCMSFSLERALDGVFFILSLTISLACCTDAISVEGAILVPKPSLSSSNKLIIILKSTTTQVFLEIWEQMSNPIEHLWDEVQRRLNDVRPRPTIAAKLSQVYHRIWAKGPMGFINRLIHSMYRRWNAVVNAHPVIKYDQGDYESTTFGGLL